MAASSPSSSPAPLSRKTVPGRFIQTSQSRSEGLSLVPLLDHEQPHHDPETVSPTSFHGISNSSDNSEADGADISLSSTESHDTSGQCMNEQDGPASTTLPELSETPKHGKLHWLVYIRKFWFWEVAACILSFACFGSIVVVLLCERDKSLDEWQLSIPPPATISFIGTLAKASLVLVLSQVLSQMKWLQFQSVQPLDQLKAFDSASRGPLGSITVLRKSRRVLTSIAACLMILTILLDPFVQLVFAFPTKLVPDPSQSATFQYVKTFGALGLIQNGPGTRLWSALNQGLTNANITQEINCSTGNCTWSEPVNTLGICGSCSEANVTRTCSPTNFLSSDDGINVTTCFYTFNDVLLSTPNDGDKALTIAAYIYKDSFSNKSVDGQWGTAWNATSYSSFTRVDKNPPFSMNDTFDATIEDGEDSDTISSKPVTVHYSDRGGILEFAAVQVNLTGSWDKDEYLVPPTRCWTCKLNWCEKTFEEIRVINNQLTLTVSEKPLWGFSDDKYDYNWLSQKYGVLPEDVILQVNTSKSLRAKYIYDSQEFAWLLDVFHSYDLYKLGNQSWPSSAGTNLADNAGMQASMVFSEDLNTTINRIAESFSEFVRTNPDWEEEHGNASGDALVSKSFIEVRWEWLVLPIAVLLMTSILLMIVAIRSYKMGVSTWKDDPTALLFHRVAGLETDLSDDKSITMPEDLVKLTNGVFVKLSSDETLTFVKCAEKVKQQ